MWLRSFAVGRTLLPKLRLSDSLRRQCEWIGKAIGVQEIKEIAMAKVIEFYIPARFRRPLKAAPQAKVGRIIEFYLPTRKSA